MSLLGRRRTTRLQWLLPVLGSLVLGNPFPGGEKSVVVLDKHNFESDAVKPAVKGKLGVALVKFHKPDCMACKKAESTWQKLADIFKHNPKILIGDVNCNSTAAQPICKAQRIRKVPTVRFFNKDTGKRGDTYKRTKSFKALEQFAYKAAKYCDPKDMEHCSKEDRELMSKMKDKPLVKVESELTRFRKMVIAAKPDQVEKFQRRIALLQALVDMNEKNDDDGDDEIDDEEL